MEFIKGKKVLVSGASMAGLSTALCLSKIGYRVTVVELAKAPRTNGAAVDIKDDAIADIRRMGVYDQLKLHRLQVNMVSFKNASDITENSILLNSEHLEEFDEIEIERDQFVKVMLDQLKNDVEFIFSDRIIDLTESEDGIIASFQQGKQETYHFVVGCDGLHSGVRNLWFGEENKYAQFLGAYFSFSIIDKLLIEEKTMQMFNVPGKAITLNAYNGKTDIIFCTLSEDEILYNYRDIAWQRKFISDGFSSEGWRTAELLNEVANAAHFYFDKFAQIKMPSWTKGRVVLVGDAGYCASPAAGMGASLSIRGATVLADALLKHKGNLKLAFEEYNQNLRPLINEVQEMAVLNLKDKFIPRTEEAIRQRNAQQLPF
ncbi:FAD-dependent monooxygenase [Pedobacter mucosus]|uniref:FAD-dependent monooxygenase n=1 Tax=Pedobacter mucosus TaxID=2895286 RepID=UPI001EE3DFAF|nr:FAD-dependent monooxygenase [Pedobacter mucosus]UKT64670.1 FAD-dependent monooxygenase [Pedobacter mucosus]